MKDLIFFSFLLLFASLRGQTNIPPNDVLRGPQNLLPEGVIDGVVLKDEIPVRSKIEYEHVRLADYVWSKRLFSRIDSREKVNHALFYPYDEFNQVEYKFPSKRTDVDSNLYWMRHQERFSLWTIIYKHLLLGDLTLYNVSSESTPYIEDGYQLKYPIEKITRDDFFTNSKYRSELGKALTFGQKGSKLTIADPNNAPKGRLSVDKGWNATFQAWIDSLTVVTPNSTVEKNDNDDKLTVYDALQIMASDAKGRKDLEEAWNNAKPGGSLKGKDAVYFINSKSIIAYNIKEDWFFDKERSMLDKRIIAIAPVANYLVPEEEDPDPFAGFDRYANFLFYDIDGKLKYLEVDADDATISTTEINGIPYAQKEMFWLYFPELRNVIVNYYVYNNQSDAQWMSFDDFFWKRLFSAQIYKATDQFDRDIEDYRYGVDALYEAQKIKETMRTWETDLWHY